MDKLTINFVGNFQNGYVGEQADQVHLIREMEKLGHKVQRVPQDIWREYVLGSNDPSWENKLPIKADINIITKWHHFYDGRFITKLREMSNAPVFYWVWDFMYDMGLPDWHMDMLKEADLYLGNDVRGRDYPYFLKDKCYYFPFDVADQEIMAYKSNNFLYDVAFFGSYIGQGDRIEWLKEINKTNPVKVFSWNHEEFLKAGFDAESPVYGEKFNLAVSQSKIILGFSVEPDCWGYWSNRVGKVLLAGGFLLYQYAPGMELFLRDGVEYFSSVAEAREKIDFYLIAETERKAIAERGFQIGRDRFSSKARIKELIILIERYLQKNGTDWQL